MTAPKPVVPVEAWVVQTDDGSMYCGAHPYMSADEAAAAALQIAKDLACDARVVHLVEAGSPEDVAHLLHAVLDAHDELDRVTRTVHSVGALQAAVRARDEAMAAVRAALAGGEPRPDVAVLRGKVAQLRAVCAAGDRDCHCAWRDRTAFGRAFDALPEDEKATIRERDKT